LAVAALVVIARGHRRPHSRDRRNEDQLIGVGGSAS
jgi:hypothetical protein